MHSTVQSPPHSKWAFFVHFCGIPCCSVTAHWLLALHWVLLTRLWLSLLYTLPHQGFIHSAGVLLSFPFSRNSPGSPSLSWSIWQMFPVLWSSLWDVWSQLGQCDQEELWIQTEAFGGPSLHIHARLGAWSLSQAGGGWAVLLSVL